MGTCLLLLQKREQHITTRPCLMDVLSSPQLVPLSSQPPEPQNCPLHWFGGCPPLGLDLTASCHVRSHQKNKELSTWCHCFASLPEKPCGCFAGLPSWKRVTACSGQPRPAQANPVVGSPAPSPRQSPGQKGEN